MLKMFNESCPSEIHIFSLFYKRFIFIFNFGRALNIPVSDYTFDDCKLMESASRCKLMFAKSIADMSRLREKIG